MHLFHLVDLPHCYLTTKQPLQKFNSYTKAKRTERGRERKKRKRKVGKVICSSAPRGQTHRHLRGLIRLSLQYSRLSFDDPSHHLSLFPLSASSHTHTQTHTQAHHISLFSGSTFVSLFHLPCSLFPTFFCLSPSLFRFLLCLTTFEVCHSSCFVESYSLISTSVFVTLVQFHSWVVTAGRFR